MEKKNESATPVKKRCEEKRAWNQRIRDPGSERQNFGILRAKNKMRIKSQKQRTAKKKNGIGRKKFLAHPGKPRERVQPKVHVKNEKKEVRARRGFSRNTAKHCRCS